MLAAILVAGVVTLIPLLRGRNSPIEEAPQEHQ
jgi:UDP-GlcNAc:undecaprenyl-phosphate GlcNAc-1-phosphate transferase